jgi:hypothetical protein
VTYGELYPFDYNFINLKLNAEYLVGAINGTTYNLSWKYSLNVVEGTATFSGFRWKDFLNTWTPYTKPSGERLIVGFQRSEQNLQYLIIIPLMWFLTLVAFMPVCIGKKKSAVFQFYTSMLVFAPVFIFAIQSFIPPRNTLSIPEFLSFTLVLTSTLMIIVTLPKYKNAKQRSRYEVYGLLGSLAFPYTMGILLYKDFLNFSVSGIAVLFILVFLTVVFGAAAIIRLKEYEKYEKKKLEKWEKLFEEYNPKDYDY